MKNLLLLAFLLAAFVASAHAALPRSAVTSEAVWVYGMYTSADPFCETGLVATIPLSTTPKQIDFVLSPEIGNGPIATPIQCVVFVMKDSIYAAWASGEYTGTTQGNDDTPCNSGGDMTQTICRGGGEQSITVAWPSQITQDMDAVGLTPTTECPPGGTDGNAVVAVYLSPNSACTGVSSADPAECYDAQYGFPLYNGFMPPTASGDTQHGFNIAVPAEGQSEYTFVMDPDQTVGGMDNSTICANVSPPRFSFR